MNSKIKNLVQNLAIGLFIFTVLLLPVLSFAQNGTNPTGNGSDQNGTNPVGQNGTNSGDGKIVNPIKTDNIADFIKTILEGVLRIGMPIIALAIIYCGFLFVQARGNPEAITKARESLIYTLIGAAILLGSWTIAQLITETVKSL
ncbi:pilin [Candidatus Nomurabacteria bacterium]|nr:pilin [Candidatus Nomurabacteria bacterium]